MSTPVTERDVHLIRMNCGLFSDLDIQKTYDDTLAEIADKKEEIDRLRSILALLESEHVRRNPSDAKQANEACAKGLHGYCPGGHE